MDARKIGNGRKDTLTIVAYLAANTSETGRAAQIASSATFGDKNDWFLPSAGELNLLYLNRAAVGNMGIGIFWSSSQFDNYLAWGQGFNGGGRFNYDKSNYLQDYDPNVRAVRAF